MTAILPVKPAASVIAEVAGLPAVVVIDAAVIARIDLLEQRHAGLPAYSVATLGESEPIVREAAVLLRQLEQDRVRVGAAPLALTRAINAAAKDPADRLDRIKRAVEAGHLRVRAEEAARVREAERARQAAERAAADAEEARRRAERRAEADRVERDAALLQLSQDAMTAGDISALGELALEAKQVETAEASRVADLAAAQREAAADAYVSALDAQPAPLPRSAVTIRTVRKLEVFDATLVPDVVHGVVVKTIDRRVLEGLLRQGLEVPGCRLIETQEAGTRL